MSDSEHTSTKSKALQEAPDEAATRKRLGRLCSSCGRRTSTCRQCGHRSYCYFCNSCNRHGQETPPPEMIRPARDTSGRLFVVQVAFLTSRGWSETIDVRVRARGLAGAIWHGVRQARRERLRRGAHVKQARVSAVAA